MIDNYKSSYCRNVVNLEANDNNISSTKPNTEYDYFINSDFENCNMLNYITTQLDSKDFCMLNMHYNMGYSYSEIGSEFNMTSTTVSNRVNYVKYKLKNNIPKDMVLT